MSKAKKAPAMSPREAARAAAKAPTPWNMPRPLWMATAVCAFIIFLAGISLGRVGLSVMALVLGIICEYVGHDAIVGPYEARKAALQAQFGTIDTRDLIRARRAGKKPRRRHNK